MTETKQSVHWTFWAISVMALVWHLLGSLNFVVQMIPGSIEGYRETERLIIEVRPVWATAGFALAVFGGFIGSILLLLKKKSAFYFFALSFVGVVIAMIHALTTGIDFGMSEVVGIITMPIAFGLFLIWFTKRAESLGWIG